jgi:hypothetical protein
MFKVYIEESTFAAPQPMEVSPDASIAKLVPALVEELQLPQDDRSGNRLVYFLRHSADGRVLPDHFSLRAAGIAPDDHLTLEAYAADGVPVPVTPVAPVGAPNRSFHADATLADGNAFAGVGSPVEQTQFAMPPLPGGRHLSRRALFMTGGAVLGVAGAGLAYAAYHSFSGQHTPGAPVTSQQHTTMATTAPAATAPAQTAAALPTRATAQFVFRQHMQIVRTVGWSPDGTRLASGASDKQLMIWNTTGQVQMRKGQDAPVHAVAWSPDNRQLAASAGTTVLFMNVQNSMTEARATHVHRAAVTALAWSRQQPQFLVSGGLDKLAVIWNTTTFKPQTLFRQHTTGILAANWSADGLTVGTCSQGGVIRVWNGRDSQQAHGFFSDGAVAMNALAFEPAGTRLAVGGMDGILRLWQSGLTCQMMGNGKMQGQCLDKPQRLSGHVRPIRALAWSPDGRLLASAGDDGMLIIWSPAQSAMPLLKVPQNAPVLAISWSPDGKTIAAAAGNTVTLWALM